MASKVPYKRPQRIICKALRRENLALDPRACFVWAEWGNLNLSNNRLHIARFDVVARLPILFIFHIHCISITHT